MISSGLTAILRKWPMKIPAQQEAVSGGYVYMELDRKGPACKTYSIYKLCVVFNGVENIFCDKILLDWF